MVYLFDRPGSSVYFIPNWWPGVTWTPSFFGGLGQYLPTFSHTFAFILLTTAVIGVHRRAALLACAGWLVVDSVFEIAQADLLADRIVQFLPHWFSEWPLLDNFAAYLLVGRFDPFDLVSIVLASVAACLLLSYLNRRGVGHAE